MRVDQVGHLRELGAQVRRLRFARGLTLVETARLVNEALSDDGNLSFQMLSQIEKDGQATTTEKLDTIVRVLGGRLVILETATPVISVPEDLSPERAEIVERFLAVLPHVPSQALEVFQIELRLWQARYAPKDG